MSSAEAGYSTCEVKFASLPPYDRHEGMLQSPFGTVSPRHACDPPVLGYERFKKRRRSCDSPISNQTTTLKQGKTALLKGRPFPCYASSLCLSLGSSLLPFPCRMLSPSLPVGTPLYLAFDFPSWFPPSTVYVRVRSHVPPYPGTGCCIPPASWPLRCDWRSGSQVHIPRSSVNVGDVVLLVAGAVGGCSPVRSW